MNPDLKDLRVAVVPTETGNGIDQSSTYEEIVAQWYQPDYWTSMHGETDKIDALIEEFNAEVGLL